PRHIPMMYFRCDATDLALNALKPRWIESAFRGSFWSWDIHTTLTARSFSVRANGAHIGQGLLLEDLADSRYVGHCLVRGMCTLRISPMCAKLESVPRVIAL